MQRSLKMSSASLLRLLQSRCTFLTRGIRGGRVPPALNYNLHNLEVNDEWEAFDKAREAEYEAVKQVENPKKKPRDLIAEEQHRRKVMYKIIEKRHFKQPQEVNLLTWDAKEQIRYLHKEFPDEWPVGRLAESFPISRDGVIKLLQSKFVPDSVDRIIRHDKQVQQRWLQLKSGKLDKGGPLALRYQQLIDAGKLHTLALAAGNTALPAPRTKAYLTSGPVLTDFGMFHAIVKDYCARKKQEEKPDNLKEQLKLSTEENRKMLADVAKAMEVSKGLNKTIMSSFTYSDENMVEKKTVTIPQAPQTLLDVEDMQEKTFQVKNGNITDAAKVSVLKESDALNFDDEEITLHKSNKDDPVFGTNMEYLKKKKKILQELKYEKTTDRNKQINAYRFDHELGYQHPFGRVSSQPHHVHVSKPLHRRNKDALYRKGDSFYDETGDFLYRVPGLDD